MPWVQTDGRRYYYESRRINGRQTKFYRGTGAVAEAAAAEVECRKAVRAAARDALAAAERARDDALSALEHPALQTELLTHAQSARRRLPPPQRQPLEAPPRCSLAPPEQSRPPLLAIKPILQRAHAGDPEALEQLKQV
jgi:hypothetical protein